MLPLGSRKETFNMSTILVFSMREMGSKMDQDKSVFTNLVSIDNG